MRPQQRVDIFHMVGMVVSQKNTLHIAKVDAIVGKHIDNLIFIDTHVNQYASPFSAYIAGISA